MSNSRQEPLIRFWAVDCDRPERFDWAPGEWPRLVYGARRALWVEHAGARWMLSPATGFWLPAGAGHSTEFRGGLQLRTLCFHPSLSVERPAGLLRVDALLRALIDVACAEGPLGGDGASGRLAGVLVDRVLGAEPGEDPLPMPGSPALAVVARAALGDLRTTPEVLAGHAAMSLRTFERRFVAETGMSAGRWLRRARLLEATRLLSEGATLGAAAWAVGYSSASALRHALGARSTRERAARWPYTGTSISMS